MIRWLWLSLFVILLDQGSKQIANTLMIEGEVQVLLPFFNLTLAYNPGAAFSFLSDQGGWQRYFFIVLALVVTAVMLVWLSRLKREEGWIAAALGLIIGGAVGNLIDRIWLGHVIDFIQLHYADLYWPAFNVADSAIFLGVAIMLLDSLVLSARRR
ncbi:MAG: signal peptidase II [Chromatiales bacterium]|jgi:signal peptidase II